MDKAIETAEPLLQRGHARKGPTKNITQDVTQKSGSRGSIRHILILLGYAYSFGIFACAVVLSVQYHFGDLRLRSPASSPEAHSLPTRETPQNGEENNSRFENQQNQASDHPKATLEKDRSPARPRPKMKSHG